MSEVNGIRRFPWLTLLGTLFAIMICITASGMIYIVYPQSGRLVELFLGKEDKEINYISSQSIFSNEPTPFQPLLSENAPLLPVVDLVPTPTRSEPMIPTQTPIPKKVPESNNSIPASSYINGIYGSAQLYTLDCESQSAVDWARYFGIEISHREFIDRLPRSDDPEEGFVGNINGPMGQIPPGDYGIYPGPVAKLLNDYELDAKAVKNWEIDALKREIANGRPVIVWIVNLPFAVNPSEYTASNGNTTIVAPFQHTWIVTGYNTSTFTVVDSEWTYNVKYSTFIERWSVFDNQAIIMKPE